MNEIKRKELETLLTTYLESDKTITSEEFNIVHLNGMTIYYSDYQIRVFDDGNVMITFDCVNEVCTCVFSTTLLDYLLLDICTLYKIID